MNFSTIGAKVVDSLSGGILGKVSDKLLDIIPDNMSESERSEYQIKVTSLLHEQQVEYLRIAKETEESYIKDIQDARSREVGVTSATGKRDWMLHGLASILVLGFFTVLGIVIYRDLSDNQTANIMLGYLAGAFSGVVTYFFGSSQGSKQKTDLLNSKAKQIEHKAIVVDE